MLEIHIEQSTVLEKEKISIGLVEGIAAIRQYVVTLTGVANHAGATLMEDRHDSLQGAAHMITAIGQIASQHSARSVATIGQIKAEPGVVNVIPGKTHFSLDIRDTSTDSLTSMLAKIERAIDEISSQRSLRYTIEKRQDVPQVPMASEIVGLIEDKATAMNIQTLRMFSGAGHDTMLFADIAQTGMIFLPSKDGRSHCPEEFTKAEDIALGTKILLETIVCLAN